MLTNSFKDLLNFSHYASSYFQAGDLFSLEDLQIIQDLRLVLTKIREIISAPDLAAITMISPWLRFVLPALLQVNALLNCFFKVYHLVFSTLLN